jgi:hypothetical protein
MKLIYSDSPSIDEMTFRRLMLLGTELTFVERPSVSLDENIATIAMPSNVSGLISEFHGSPINLKVETPPTTIFSSNFYEEFFHIDLKSEKFINSVINAIEANMFDHWIFDKEQCQHEGEFTDLKKWIIENRHEFFNIDYSNITQPEDPFKVTDRNGAFYALKTLLSEQSLRVTSILSICEKNNCNPLSVNPYLNDLICQRISDSKYVGKSVVTRQLGIRLMESIIPDEALLHLTISDLLIFREKTKALYQAWEIELNKLESKLSNINIDFPYDEIVRFVDTDINPEILRIKNEIQKVKDDLFAKIIKLVKNAGFSFITSGTLCTMDWKTAIISFVVSNLATKTPELTDNIIDTHFKLKDIKRSNGLTYLLKINKLIDK